MKSIFANIYNLLRCHRINRNIKFGSFWNFIHGFSNLGILQRKGGYLDDPILKDIFVSK